jgi:predicted negative regulator of RcsB-dependent stress response
MSRLAQLQQMVVDEPFDPFVHYALAMEHVKLGETEIALQQLAAMNGTFPDYVAAWHQRGRLLVEKGESDAAREVLQRGIAAAQRAGDSHAAGEMQGLLDMLQAEW